MIPQQRFASDLAARKDISSLKLRIVDAANGLYTHHSPPADNKFGQAIRHSEDRVVTGYLKSSDFFSQRRRQKSYGQLPWVLRFVGGLQQPVRAACQRSIAGIGNANFVTYDGGAVVTADLVWRNKLFCRSHLNRSGNAWSICSSSRDSGASPPRVDSARGVVGWLTSVWPLRRAPARTRRVQSAPHSRRVHGQAEPGADAASCCHARAGNTPWF